jgi:hypothetical protein
VFGARAVGASGAFFRHLHLVKSEGLVVNCFWLVVPFLGVFPLPRCEDTTYFVDLIKARVLRPILVQAYAGRKGGVRVKGRRKTLY